MKRIVAILLVAVLVIMTAGCALAATIKLTEKMYIRKGAGDGYTAVGIASAGTKLKVVKASSKDGTLWWKITSGKYKGRYVSSAYSTAVPSKFKITVKTTGTANFRKGPTTGSDKICSIGSGKKLVCTGYKNGWFRVIYKGKTGYVYGYRLKAA